MATMTFLSFPEDVYKGNIDCDTDTFYVMLVNGYTPNQTTHTRRSDVTGEVTGPGYTAGGVAVTCTVAKNTGTKQITLTFAAASWPSSTISATGAVYYKRRGGAASADEIVGFDDFGGTVSSSGAAFDLAASVFTHTVTV